MSHEFGCSFCEQLPETSACGWGGRASKCPVCKQELWTDQHGGTHRIVAGASTSHRVGLKPAGFGGALAICVIAGIAIWLSVRQSPAPITPARQPVAIASNVAEPEVAVVAEPIAQAKPAQGYNAARTKPTATPKPAPPVVVASAPAKPAAEPARVQSPAPIAPLSSSLSFLGNVDDLEAKLRLVPEVDFDPQYAKKTKKELADIAKDIVKVNRESAPKVDAKKNGSSHDGFIRKLTKDRPDLAGMPFLLGPDCSITGDEAKTLLTSSAAIREAFAAAARVTQPKTVPGPAVGPQAHWVWGRFTSKNAHVWKQPDRLPALQQIFVAENRDFRFQLVGHLNDVKGAKAGELLANRAVFDLDPDVRTAAINILSDRPKNEYRAVLVKALRYPWMPAVRHAVHAIVTLELKETAADLVPLLEETPPEAPFSVPGEDGKVKFMVRELVRVNHHRNCMLCHPPLSDNAEEIRESRELPIGPVPPAQEPLPSSRSGYEARSGSTLIRADITYLRQDFSLQQEVQQPGKWPAMQRFDFLVRTRELTQKEIDERPPLAVIEYRETIAFALRRLTGRQLPPVGQTWRDALDLPAPKVSAK